MKQIISRLTTFLNKLGKGDFIRRTEILDAIILASWMTGQQKDDLHEVKMIMQVFPHKGKNFIAHHSGYFHESEMRLLLKTGHKVQVSSGEPGRARLLLTH